MIDWWWRVLEDNDFLRQIVVTLTYTILTFIRHLLSSFLFTGPIPIQYLLFWGGWWWWWGQQTKTWSYFIHSLTSFSIDCYRSLLLSVSSSFAIGMSSVSQCHFFRSSINSIVEKIQKRTKFASYGPSHTDGFSSIPYYQWKGTNIEPISIWMHHTTTHWNTMDNLASSKRY